MSIEYRLDAIATHLEGKTQELLGELANSPATQVKGQANQARARMQNAVEAVKEKLTVKL